MKTAATDALWAAFRAAHPSDGSDAAEPHDVASFGDSPAMAEELAQLVLRGPKRATAGLLRDVGEGGEPLPRLGGAAPRLGGHVVLLGGEGTPRGIWRTIDLRVGPLSSVDDAFAWGECPLDHGPGDRVQARTPGAVRRAWGEGDWTREGWLRLHRAFFARQAEREGWEMTDDEPTVFDRFALAWPPPG